MKVTLMMCFNQPILHLITKIQKSVIFNDSKIDHSISISKFNPLVGSSYVKLPKELYHP